MNNDLFKISQALQVDAPETYNIAFLEYREEHEIREGDNPRIRFHFNRKEMFAHRNSGYQVIACNVTNKDAMEFIDIISKKFFEIETQINLSANQVRQLWEIFVYNKQLQMFTAKFRKTHKLPLKKYEVFPHRGSYI